MGSNMRNLIFTLVALIVVLGGGYFWYSYSVGVCTTPPVATTTPPQATSTPTTSSVMIAVLDTAGTSNGKPRACDKVILIPRTVAETTAPLTAALQNLFAISTTSVGGYFNYIARTNATLKFDRATVVAGTANIYLTGSLTGMAGVCDDPRASVQIEETAPQFSTVQRVQLYRNNATTTVVPSQR